ncbi:Down syndrome cell adhesion molecule homolog isoform X2 [Limulus polyphemus]|uniref:Down syndrome cell adhesion molecule homolog isoform X2 n=1 Tax=Limulus polyphemus TaxID=6850 RepID=A0ABM1SRB5_LIMPO|nr:Down syndrome cell adhesion molecule homolog isoform X2 [Limulus polyphemus]
MLYEKVKNLLDFMLRFFGKEFPTSFIVRRASLELVFVLTALNLYVTVNAEANVRIQPFTFPQKVEEGEQVQITCGVKAGDDPIEFSWFKDNKILQTGNIWTIHNHARVSLLIINDVKVTASGNYTCLAKNKYGEEGFTSELRVKGPPQWKNKPKNQVANNGETVVFSCTAYGFPTPNIQWWRIIENEKVLPLSSSGQPLKDNGGVLIIEELTEADDGLFRCDVSNGIGDLSAVVTLKVKVTSGLPVSILFPFFLLVSWSSSEETVKIRPFSFPEGVEEGEEVQVVCGLKERDGNVKFSWVKDGLILKSREGFNIHSTDKFSVLTVTNVHSIESGNYTCKAENSAGRDIYTAELLVKGPPSWHLKPSDTSVNLGDTVRIPCRTFGFPTPRITWTNENGGIWKEIPGNTIPNRVYVLDGTLVMETVKEEDNGLYACKSWNGIGEELQKTIRLNTIVPARFEEKFDVKRIHRGDSAKLECDARGDNPMTITWNKDNIRLSRVDTSRYQIFDRTTEGGMLSEIQVHGVDRSDNGLFTCLAKNTYGEDQRTIKMIVLEPPSAPSDVRVDQAWSRSISVTWTVPYSGNSPVNKYLIQYWRNQGAPHRLEEVTVSSAQTSTILRELQPGTSYVVRVIAENNVGKGTPSENRRFLTKEEEPSAPPTDVQVEARGAGTFHIKWKAPSKDHWNGQLKGYYVGYKEKASTDSYSYKLVPFSEGLAEEYLLRHLLKNTEYGIVVRAFNDAGTGPESQEILKRTKDSDPPPPPSLWVSAQSETTITINWEQSSDIISHYILFYKEDSGTWTEVTIPQTEKKVYTLQGLRAGSVYHLYLQAASQIGNSNPSETVSVKTDGAKGPMKWNFHAVITGEEELPVYLRLPVLAPLAASVAIIVFALVLSCVYVKKEQRRYNRAMAVTEKIYPYSMNGTLPHRYVDLEKTRPLLQPPPPPPMFPLPPPPPPDDYPASSSTLPVNGNNNNSGDRRRLKKGREPKSNEGSIDSRRQGGGNMIQERAEVHHYDEAA